MSLLARRFSRLHKIVGIAVGIQLFFWTVSGLFFTLFPIELIWKGIPKRLWKSLSLWMTHKPCWMQAVISPVGKPWDFVSLHTSKKVMHE